MQRRHSSLPNLCVGRHNKQLLSAIIEQCNRLHRSSGAPPNPRPRATSWAEAAAACLLAAELAGVETLGPRCNDVGSTSASVWHATIVPGLPAGDVTRTPSFAFDDGCLDDCKLALSLSAISCLMHGHAALGSMDPGQIAKWRTTRLPPGSMEQSGTTM